MIVGAIKRNKNKKIKNKIILVFFAISFLFYPLKNFKARVCQGKGLSRQGSVKARVLTRVFGKFKIKVMENWQKKNLINLIILPVLLVLLDFETS
jgi:hypothetical protein